MRTNCVSIMIGSHPLHFWHKSFYCFFPLATLTKIASQNIMHAVLNHLFLLLFFFLPFTWLSKALSLLLTGLNDEILGFTGKGGWVWFSVLSCVMAFIFLRAAKRSKEGCWPGGGGGSSGIFNNFFTCGRLITVIHHHINCYCYAAIINLNYTHTL